MCLCGARVGDVRQKQERGSILGPLSLFKYVYKILIRYQELCVSKYGRKNYIRKILLSYGLKEYISNLLF